MAQFVEEVFQWTVFICESNADFTGGDSGGGHGVEDGGRVSDL